MLQVGHLLRYSAEHRAISSRIARPLYIDATRIAPFKPRGTDVSVILDLMIHDLDLVLALVDSPIRSVDALGAAVSSPLEDIANARVRFENGCVATITASRISLKTERRMRMFSEEGYLSADFVARKLTMIGRERGLPLPGTGGFRREEVGWAEHDTMEAEHAGVRRLLPGWRARCWWTPPPAAGRWPRRWRSPRASPNSRRLAMASGLIQTPRARRGRRRLTASPGGGRSECDHPGERRALAPCGRAIGEQVQHGRLPAFPACSPPAAVPARPRAPPAG